MERINHKTVEKNMYLDNGYVNMEYLISIPRTFIWIIGARGIGKTYGAVDYVLNHNIQSIFMRRTQQQCDTISTYALCQAKPNFDDRGEDYCIESIAGGIKGIYRSKTDEDGNKKVTGDILFLNCALSTIFNIRGFDASQFSIFFYDEFIPEKHARPIKNEGEAFLNAYETINRNRELKGNLPVKFVGMSNSNRLANNLFADLDMITCCDRQFRMGYAVYDDPKRDMCVINYENSEISKKKNETALYKFAPTQSDFAKMALENEFTDYKSETANYNLKDLEPICNLGSLTIYHIRNKPLYHCCVHYMQAKLKYEDNEREMLQYKLSDWCKGFIGLYIRGMMTFDSYNSEYLFKRYCDKSKSSL